ncbi:competence protein CoiA [Bacillus sp. FJAT-22090]|uniref:competence protein CoiA n=1 Tax=Bacillus sp. FJAT-22090 TaxID=1581038 RepID=UPI0011AA6664|nr:competence protein CoiA family protein [Bacillus sp. FJAT-22090]
MVFILTAATKQGDIIISSNYSREYLKQFKKNNSFLCLQCNEEVILKNGLINIPHFAHKRHSECNHSFSEGESEDHLNGKIQLYEFFQKQKRNPQLEPFIPSIKQRPDILMQSRQTSIAIEFQCSPILLTKMLQRHEGYKQQNIEPLWILRTPSISEFPSREIGLMRLSAYYRQFFLVTPTNGKMIITYNPQNKHFHYISDPLHIKSNNYIVKVKKLSLEKQSWPFAIVKRITMYEYENYLRIYREQRFKHVNNLYYFNRKGVQSIFLQICYRWQLLPKRLPIFIGIPTAYASAFSVHAVEWQIQLIDYLKRFKIPIERASDHDCEMFLLTFPGASDLHPYRIKAVQAYLSILQKCLIKSDPVAYLCKFNITKMNQLLYSDFLAKRPEN